MFTMKPDGDQHHGPAIRGPDGSALFSYPVSQRRMSHGEGVFLYDHEGRDYLDCAAGTFNLSLGYANLEIVRVLQEQAADLEIARVRGIEAVATLLERDTRGVEHFRRKAQIT